MVLLLSNDEKMTDILVQILNRVKPDLQIEWSSFAQSDGDDSELLENEVNRKQPDLIVAVAELGMSAMMLKDRRVLLVNPSFFRYGYKPDECDFSKKLCQKIFDFDSGEVNYRYYQIRENIYALYMDADRKGVDSARDFLMDSHICIFEGINRKTDRKSKEFLLKIIDKSDEYQKRECPICRYHTIFGVLEHCPVCGWDAGICDDCYEALDKKEIGVDTTSNRLRNIELARKDYAVYGKTGNALKLRAPFGNEKTEPDKEEQDIMNSPFNSFYWAMKDYGYIDAQSERARQDYKVFNTLALIRTPIGLAAGYMLMMCHQNGFGCRKDMGYASEIKYEIEEYLNLLKQVEEHKKTGTQSASIKV